MNSLDINSLDLSLDLLEEIEAPELSTNEGIGLVMIALGVGILIGIAT